MSSKGQLKKRIVRADCHGQEFYCGECAYEYKVYCMEPMPNNPGVFCGKPPEHEGNHGPRATDLRMVETRGV